MSEQTRYEVIDLLRQRLRGVDVADLAKEYGITVVKDGKYNKGWVGQTLDRVAKTIGLSAQRADGVDYELKSVSVVSRNGEWVARETIAITMFNPRAILTDTFETSALWHKLGRLILVGHSYGSNPHSSAIVRFVAPVDVSDSILVRKIADYWNEIREIVISGRISDYSSKGTSTGFVQLRTKGSSGSTSVCPITQRQFKTRAFYATKNFVRYVRGNMA